MVHTNKDDNTGTSNNTNDDSGRSAENMIQQAAEDAWMRRRTVGILASCRTETGKRVLGRISKSRLPDIVRVWPDKEGAECLSLP